MPKLHVDCTWKQYTTAISGC